MAVLMLKADGQRKLEGQPASGLSLSNVKLAIALLSMSGFRYVLLQEATARFKTGAMRPCKDEVT